MPYQRRRRTRYVIWGKLRPFLLSLLGLTALVGLWWWLTQIGPRSVKIDEKPISEVPGDSELAAMQKQVADLRKLNDLQRDRDSAVAEGINARIRELDADATQSRGAGEIYAGETHWTVALRLQQQINRSAATSALKNFVREGRFEQQLQELSATPVAAEVREAMDVAREAMTAEEWADALAP